MTKKGDKSDKKTIIKRLIKKEKDDSPQSAHRSIFFGDDADETF